MAQDPNAYHGNADHETRYRGEIHNVQSTDLIERAKALFHEGNVRRISVKREGLTVVEFPLTIGVVAAIIAPAFAAIGAIGALIAHCSIEVVRADRP
ncbi:MAG: DUF4342 domain-containing protein [Chloroflexota bacterium]|nr:DUF4342 domain-containing protein [Chloroflexota bacterium]